MHDVIHFFIIDDSFEEVSIIRSGIKSNFGVSESSQKSLESENARYYTNKYRSGLKPFDITEMYEPSVEGISEFIRKNRKSLLVFIVDMVWSNKEKSEVYDSESGLFKMEFSKMFSRIDELYHHKENSLPGGLRFVYNWFMNWSGLFDISPLIIAKSAYFTPELMTSLRAFGVTKFLESAHRNNEVLLTNLIRESVDDMESRIKIFRQPGIRFTNDNDIHLFPKTIHKKIQAAAASDDSVLVLGNEGAGKRSVAELIHFSSKRKSFPFISFYCSENKAEDISTIFFGSDGLFERANEGTLYLGAINQLSIPNQEKLFSVIKDGRFWSQEKNKFTEINIRLIASVLGDPLVEIDSNALSGSLYHKIKVIDIKMPSLVERKNEIKVLAEHFLRKYKLTYGKPMARISDEAIDALKAYLWPGNVRELENTIKKALLFCEADAPVTVKDLQLEIRLEETEEYSNSESLSDEYIRRIILNYLEENGRNVAGLATKLRLTRQTVYNKIKTFGINIKDYPKKK